MPSTSTITIGKMKLMLAIILYAFINIILASGTEVPEESRMKDALAASNYVVGAKCDNVNACTTTAKACTLAMWVRHAAIASQQGFGAGENFAANMNMQICVFDSSCVSMGCFVQPDGGLPWTLQSDQWSSNILIDTIFMSVGDPYIRFYHNDQIKSANGACACENDNAGLAFATVWCRCEFACSRAN